jgi:CheY-like chemotaxis protein
MTAAKTLKIFIVENHRDTLESLKMYFEDLGHKVRSSTLVAEDLATLPTSEVDLLLCDIGLPDGTGWELLQQLKMTKPPLAVAMSGFGMNADSARSAEAGFRYHLLKPFKASELDKILIDAFGEDVTHIRFE